MKTGKVYLAGAGPGDPGLITVKAIERLNKADVIVYDQLIDTTLLESAPPHAEKIYAGKVADKHALPQDEINRLLVDKAKEGKTVVRLKGGDPFVFGRGGEEAEVLAENGIPFEIIPGITSSVAVPAYAGIPVSHRGLASSLAVITGHEDPTKANSSINWEKLAGGVDTLVFLMGVKNLPMIVKKLVKYGKDKNTPAAVIKNGTRPNQEMVNGTLGNIIEKVNQKGITAPAVIIVGEVVSLSNKLRWFDNLPLFGKRILVTRSRRQASKLSSLVAERGASPVELPAIDIQPLAGYKELDDSITKLINYQWVIFTSTNGVEAFWQRLASLKMDSRSLGNLSVGAIGSATAEALAERGITADYMPQVYTGEGIIKGLKNRNISGKRILLPRADIADNELVYGLRGIGAEVDEVAAYRTVAAAEETAKAVKMVSSGEIDVITFTSSSTVTNFIAAFGEQKPHLDNVTVACIGPKTKNTAVKAGLNVDILATEQTIPGLVEAIEEHFREGV